MALLAEGLMFHSEPAAAHNRFGIRRPVISTRTHCAIWAWGLKTWREAIGAAQL
jgi:hypothetical protein